MVFFPRKFLKKKEGDQILECIRAAENKTSGEIRVHFQKKIKKPLLEAAADTFFELKMDETKDRNGILIFIVPKVKKFAIIGDEGINNIVPNDFWDEIKNILEEHFKEKSWVKGICMAIELTGEKLKKYFPVQEDDVNELPDEISYS